MKCLACDTILSPREATNRSSTTGEFLDMCSSCTREAGIVGVIHSKNIRVSDEESLEMDMDELLENDSLGG